MKYSSYNQGGIRGKMYQYYSKKVFTSLTVDEEQQLSFCDCCCEAPEKAGAHDH